MMLCMLKATSITAVAPPVGMPSARSVAIDPPSELALADSAAMMPRGSPVPKLFRILRRPPRFRIGQQIGDRVAAGKDADTAAQQRAAQQRAGMAERFAHAGQDAAGLHLPAREIIHDVFTADQVEQFRCRKETDDRRNRREYHRAAGRSQRCRAAAPRALRPTVPNSRPNTPASRPRAMWRPRRRAINVMPHSETTSISGGPSLIAKAPIGSCKTQQQQIGDHLTHTGRGERQTQRLIVTSCLRHRKAVERGANRRCRAGDVEQNGGDRHAEQRASVHRRHEDQRLKEIHVGDQRQADRQRHRRCQTRHRMDGKTNQDAR